MDNYNNLIKALRESAWIADIGDLKGYAINQRDAASAIEQLIKERDEWIMAYDHAQNAYHEWFSEAQKLTKERDAAIADLVHLTKHPLGACDICSARYCQNNVLDSGGCEFEWRGV